MTQTEWEQTSLLPPTPAELRERQKRRNSQDPCWEALLRATGANPTAERVRLNMALKIIRNCSIDREHLDPSVIPSEIERRAILYRRAFPKCTITPMALAKHWLRVSDEAEKPESREMALIQRMREQSRREALL